MVNKKNILVSFKLKQIKVLEFYINNKIKFNINEGVSFEIYPASFIDLKNTEFRILLKTTFNTNTPQKLKISGSEIELIFVIPELVNFEQQEDFLLVPENLIYTLVNISLGTCRGILFEKMVGSNISDLYMPILNIPDFVNNSLKNAKSAGFYSLKINKF